MPSLLVSALLTLVVRVVRIIRVAVLKFGNWLPLLRSPVAIDCFPLWTLSALELADAAYRAVREGALDTSSRST